MGRTSTSQLDPTIADTCAYLQIGRGTLHELTRDRRVNLRRVPGKGRGGAKRVELRSLQHLLVRGRAA